MKPSLRTVELCDLRSLGLDERDLENFLSGAPDALGLGTQVRVLDRQRPQQKGRMDLLLEDSDGESRYEVELQLGAVDESHLVRAIEYWDVERRRYPAYDHCAVLVAEDVTSRFLNVITLLTGSIPFIAIQVGAFAVDGGVGITFNRLVDTRDMLRDEEEGVGPPSDRAYWEAGTGPAIMGIVDRCLGWINEVAARRRSLTYNKYFIGLNIDGSANNFVWFNPWKAFAWVHVHRANARDPEAWRVRLLEAGVEVKVKSADGPLDVRVTTREDPARDVLLRELVQEATKAEDGIAG